MKTLIHKSTSGNLAALFKKTLICLFLSLYSGNLFCQTVVDTSHFYTFFHPLFQTSTKPKILIDGQHNNFHQKAGRYAPLNNILEEAGFQTDINTKNFEDLSELQNIDILVIANAIHQKNLGNWNNPTHSGFSKKEIANIQTWVKNGGSLLLIADHMPFAGAAADLATSFDITLLNGFTGIQQTWPPNSFSVKETNQHEVYKKYFYTDSVATFTGSAVKFPDKKYSILHFNATDSIYLCDTAWVFNKNTNVIPLKDYSQGGMMPFGRGKVAVFCEAAMFTAQISNGTKVGFSAPSAKGNLHFILNTFLSLLQKPENYDPDFAIHCDLQSIKNRYYLLDTFFHQNDMVKIASVYSEDAKIIGQNFKIEGKEAVTNYWLALKDKGVKWDHEIIELEVAGNLAYQNGVSSLEYKTDKENETIISNVHYTIIWKKNAEGLWQIYIDHYTKTGY
jgi:ketosteroid isomerase-like protein